jgi:hypothetical protein
VISKIHNEGNVLTEDVFVSEHVCVFVNIYVLYLFLSINLKFTIPEMACPMTTGFLRRQVCSIWTAVRVVLCTGVKRYCIGLSNNWLRYIRFHFFCLFHFSINLQPLAGIKLFNRGFTFHITSDYSSSIAFSFPCSSSKRQYYVRQVPKDL